MIIMEGIENKAISDSDEEKTKEGYEKCNHKLEPADVYNQSYDEQEEEFHHKDQNSNNEIRPTVIVNDTRNNNEEDFISINVSGLTYEISTDDIRKYPCSLLYRHVILERKHDRPKGLRYKRPTSSFEAILSYYQTGDLHMPMSVCPGAFKSELSFWELDPQVMSKCCYYRYISYLDDQDTLDKFHLHLFPSDSDDERPPIQKHRYICKAGCRNNLWKILDNVDSSVATKIYFVICMLAVILSVATLAISTLPEFRRPITLCEYEKLYGKRLTILNVTDDGDVNMTSCNIPLTDDLMSKLYEVKEVLANETSRAWNNETAVFTTKTTTTISPTLNVGRTGKIFPSFSPDSTNNSTNTSFSRRTTMMRTPFFTSGEVPEVSKSTEETMDVFLMLLRPKFGFPKKTVRLFALDIIDTVLLGFFTVDILLRVICCPSMKKYFLSLLNVIDIAILLAAYGHFFVNQLDTDEKYSNTTAIDILEILQIFRVLRLLRVVHNITGFKVLSFSIRFSIQDLLILALYLLLGVAVFANLVFYFEVNKQVTSIPLGWWWAMNTLTTVGYGDVVPKTFYGRILGACCAIFGVVMMSVAIPIFVKTFILLYQYAVLYKKSLMQPQQTRMYIKRQSLMIKKKDSKNLADIESGIDKEIFQRKEGKKKKNKNNVRFRKEKQLNEKFALERNGKLEKRRGSRFPDPDM